MSQAIQDAVKLVGESLDRVGATEWVRRVDDPALERNHLLRPQRQERRFIGRQRERFVFGVRM